MKLRDGPSIGSNGMLSRMLSPNKTQLIDNIVSILSNHSIKNKKEYLERYALNTTSMLGGRVMKGSKEKEEANSAAALWKIKNKSLSVSLKEPKTRSNN
jgi:hypothetical protein